MTRYDHFLRILVLACLVLAGMVATAAFSLLLAMASGASLQDLTDTQGAGLQALSAAHVRLLLAAQHMLIFILPALGTAWLFHRSRMFHQLELVTLPGPRILFLGVLFLLAAYPLVNLGFMLNEQLPLPDWVYQLEAEAAVTLRLVLDMPNIVVFAINLLIIAILPGIGEELVFRGIVQKHIMGMLRSPAAAIWISGIIFSAIHFQFEGFFPRMVLGIVLGYLYHWTGNLWVPMAAHAFNNGLQVLILYATGLEVTEFDEQSSGQLQAWMIPLGILAMYMLYRAIRKTPPHDAAT